MSATTVAGAVLVRSGVLVRGTVLAVLRLTGSGLRMVLRGTRPEEKPDRARLRAERRVMFLCLFFAVAFGAVAWRMTGLAVAEPEVAAAPASIADPILSTRADITDRQGRILATNLDTFALYAQIPDMIDPVGAAEQLAAIFPDLDAADLAADFTGERRFVWVRRQVSPEQAQAVHDIGEPGLLLGPRQMRLYPNGAVAAHVLGGAGFGREGVDSAEVVGVAGVERRFDEALRGADAAPLALSIDLTLQSAVEEVLDGGMALMNAKGASAILMDATTGEILAMASLPDFDPNDRPPVATSGDPGDSPLFNRAIQGVYELGSVFKIFAVAQGLELGLVNPQTWIDTQGPLLWGRFRIRDFHDYGPSLTVEDVIVKSSNIGTARIALMIGPDRQQEFLRRLGLLEPVPVEMAEAPSGRPLLPPQWSEISLMTISYGHGLSVSPLHLASAYATIANDGVHVPPTLVRQDGPVEGDRVLDTAVAGQAVAMLRGVVTHGTATLADVAGYEVAGKTGTADKPRPQGGYYEDKVIATFAGMFPASDPRYVLVVTLDEPVETSGEEPRRTAGWTATPVAAEIVRRVAPLLGLRPVLAAGTGEAMTVAINE